MEYNQKNVLLSIHTEYALKIIDGKKTVELRRRFPLFKKEDKKNSYLCLFSNFKNYWRVPLKGSEKTTPRRTLGYRW